MPHAVKLERKGDNFLNIRRTSAIPRPVSSKQLVLTGRNSTNHASKPAKDVIPLTPSKKVVNRTNIIIRSQCETLSKRDFDLPLSKPLPPPPRPSLPPPQPQQHQLQKQQPKQQHQLQPLQCKQQLQPLQLKQQPQPQHQQPIGRIDPNPEIPVLELIPFGKQPYVIFNNVLVHTTEVKFISIRNSLKHEQQLFVRTFPKQDRGFDMDATEFLIAPKSEIIVALTWCPKVAGNIRESITLEDANGHPRRIIINASAVKREANPNVTIRKPRQLFASRTLKSPSKVVRAPALTSNRSPMKRAGMQQATLVKLYESRKRRQSAQIVKKILSKHDDIMATKIQSYWRGVIARKQVATLRDQLKATLVIQRNVRMWIAKRKLAALKAEKLRSIILIQSYARMMIARRRLQEARSAAIVLQKNARMWIAKQNRAKALKAVVVLQSIARMLIARRMFEARLRAIVVIQKNVRMVLAKRKLEALRARLKAVIVLQSFARMVMARRELESLKARLRAIIVLQSHWRGYLCRLRARKTMDAVIKIQSLFRIVLARRQLATLKARLEAVLVLQSFARMILIKRQVAKETKAIKLIQNQWRIYLAKKELHRLRVFRDATIMIQSQCRGYLIRRKKRQAIEAYLRCTSRFNNKA